MTIEHNGKVVREQTLLMRSCLPSEQNKGYLADARLPDGVAYVSINPGMVDSDGRRTTTDVVEVVASVTMFRASTAVNEEINQDPFLGEIGLSWKPEHPFARGIHRVRRDSVPRKGLHGTIRTVRRST